MQYQRVVKRETRAARVPFASYLCCCIDGSYRRPCQLLAVPERFASCLLCQTCPCLTRVDAAHEATQYRHCCRRCSNANRCLPPSQTSSLCSSVAPVQHILPAFFPPSSRVVTGAMLHYLPNSASWHSPRTFSCPPLPARSSVALHRHSNALVDILPPEADSSISLLGDAERPNVAYSVRAFLLCSINRVALKCSCPSRFICWVVQSSPTRHRAARASVIIGSSLLRCARLSLLLAV